MFLWMKLTPRGSRALQLDVDWPDVQSTTGWECNWQPKTLSTAGRTRKLIARLSGNQLLEVLSTLLDSAS